MKQLVLISAIIFFCNSLNAQINRETSSRVISSSKTVVIRRDVSTIKVQLVQLKDSITTTRSQIDGILAGIKTDLDNTNEMGHAEAQRLKGYMDRLNNLFTMLSNM